MSLTTGVASKLPNTGTTIFTVMSALAQQHGAVNLAQGFPDFPLDSEMAEWVTEAMLAGKNQYAPMTGWPDLRLAHAEDIYRRNFIQVNPDTEITITCGATEACFTAITSIVKPGDEVLIFEPAFDVYLPAILLAGGIPKFIPLQFPEFSIPWDQVEASINSKTKLIILNSPHNPTGSIVSKEDMLQLEKIVVSNNLWLLSDEVYEHITFDDKVHYSALQFPQLRERSFVIGSFGKTFHVTGWRVGYCIAPDYLTSEFRKVHQYNTFAAATPFQYAVAKAIRQSSKIDGLTSFFQEKRDFLTNQIKGSKWEVIPSYGTCFQLLSYASFSNEEEVVLAKLLTEKYKLASIPVSVFYQDTTNNKVLRFCFAKNETTLRQAGEILCQISESL